jgi:predicted ABC-type ATPase
MFNPTLLVVAGCNGSGKSSFSKAFAPKNTFPYDYDLVFLKFYKSLIESELRDRMAHNLSSDDLTYKIQKTIQEKLSFCYETNFNSTPLYWPKIFKEAGYRIEIAFFCLDSIDKAKERVRIRVENGGHYVPDYEVEERYRLGYQNLDENWEFFDSVQLFETSRYNKEPKHLLTIESQSLIYKESFPNYLDTLLPRMTQKIK